MGLVITRSVNVVNAILFFLVDTPAVWAIHRGLMALQGLYMYKLTKAGRKVQLARSRVPIIAGELLMGVSRLPSAFVLVNIGVFLCIFFATLGVDADEQDVWKRGSFSNVTTLTIPSTISNTSKYSIHEPGDARYLTCMTSNETHAQYWPSAFNKEGRWAYNASCQTGARGYDPMLTVECVPRGKKECLLDDRPEGFGLLFGNTSKNIVKDNNDPPLYWVEEHKIVVETPSTFNWQFTRAGEPLPNEIVGSQGFVYVFRHPSPSVFPDWGNDSLIMLVHNSTTKRAFIASGKKDEDRSSLRLTIKFLLRITFNASASHEQMRSALRNNQDLAVYIMETDFLKFAAAQHIMFEYILRHMVRSVPLPPKVAFIRKGKRDVTTISTTGTVLYGIIIVLAIILFPVKELIVFLLVRRKEIPESSLFLNDFDVFSKFQRTKNDNADGVHPTDGYSIWEIVPSASTSNNIGNESTVFS